MCEGKEAALFCITGDLFCSSVNKVFIIPIIVGVCFFLNRSCWVFFQLPHTVNRHPFSKSLKSSSVLCVNVNQLVQCIILISL